MNAATTQSRGNPSAALAITLLTTSLVTMNTATAAAPRAGYDAPRRPLVEVVDARLDKCLKIDKQTGQVVPCQSAGGRPGSSSGTRNDSRPGNPSPPPAFNEFEYDYTQAGKCEIVSACPDRRPKSTEALEADGNAFEAMPTIPCGATNAVSLCQIRNHDLKKQNRN